jgi:single-strand DNA-binding protein
MGSVNKTTLIGYVGQDAEIRRLDNSKAVATVSIATTDRWKDRVSGEAKEKTEWHRVTFYDRLAEVVHEYGKKGRQVYVEAKLRNRRWTPEDGVERFATEIAGYEFQLLGAKPPVHGAQAPGGRPAGPAVDGQDDDIPY